MASWYVVYNIEFGAGFAAVTVLPGGESTLKLTANRDAKDEIGTYAAALPEARCDAVRKAVQASGYTRLPPAPPKPPETQYVVIGEGVPGSLPQNHAFPLAELPDPLRPVVKEMDGVIDELQRHPHHVLEGRAAWSSPSFVAGEPVTVDVTLRNPGRAPAEFFHPAHRGSGGRVTLVMMVGRDLPPQRLNADRDVTTVELEPADVTPLDANGRETTAAERAVLQPGETIRVRVRRKIFLAPGDYRGTVTLNTAPESIDAERSVEGALLMKMGPMTVVKPS